MSSQQGNYSCSCPGRFSAPVTRRQMLKQSCNGFGLTALSALMADSTFAHAARGPAPHFVPKAKNVIFLFMDGGVSHVDSFDPKPKLAELHNKPAAIVKGQNPTAEGNRKWLQSPWTFKRYGGAGTWVSELFPHIASCVDDLAVVRSMVGEFPLHSRGNLFIHTGSNTAGRPSLGSWVNYGLGSENRNLPGFVVLHSGMNIPSGRENFSNGFLPATYQATLARTEGAPIDNLLPSDKPRIQRAKLDLVGEQDRAFSRSQGSEEAIESAIETYELAYRMQSLVPDVLELSAESEATKKLYGIDSQDENKRRYGIECLRARRLVEAGVRFVEVLCPNVYGNTGTWDQHSKLKEGHEKNALNTDQAVAGLIKDLKSRGMLDETLIVWSGEFGRTPHAVNTDGRDHHPSAFTLWMAGGGIRGGTVLGTSDELGMHVVEDTVTIHDLHATILHLLGLDHERLTYHFGGRDFRLTDEVGRVVTEIIV